jgi:transformation/transcription domain-associated protein
MVSLVASEGAVAGMPLQPLQAVTLASALPSQPRFELPPQSEVQLWEEAWVESCKQLRQWKALRTFAQVTGDAVLMGEALSKTAHAQHLGDWDELRDLLGSSLALNLDGSRSHATKLFSVEAELNSASVNLKAANKQLEEVQNLWLREWQALPLLASPAQEQLLAQSQLIQEARDSLGMALAADQAVRAAAEFKTAITPPDIRHVIGTWRERLPNRWDGSYLWDNILTWRMHAFTLMHRSMRQHISSPEEVAKMHDAPWSVIKLAHVARKLGLRLARSGSCDPVISDDVEWYQLATA